MQRIIVLALLVILSGGCGWRTSSISPPTEYPTTGVKIYDRYEVVLTMDKAILDSLIEKAIGRDYTESELQLIETIHGRAERILPFVMTRESERGKNVTEVAIQIIGMAAAIWAAAK